MARAATRRVSQPATVRILQLASTHRRTFVDELDIVLEAGLTALGLPGLDPDARLPEQTAAPTTTEQPDPTT